MPQGPDKSTMRSLGEFFGHVLKGIKTQPADPKRTVVREAVEEEERDTPKGKVKLRRTIVEEVIVDPEQIRGKEKGGE